MFQYVNFGDFKNAETTAKIHQCTKYFFRNFTEMDSKYKNNIVILKWIESKINKTIGIYDMVHDLTYHMHR